MRGGDNLRVKVLEFYAKLCKEPCVACLMVDVLPLDRFSREESEELEGEIGEEEVWVAIASLGCDKAPSSDGFPVEFYKKCWEIIREIFFGID